MSIQSRFKRDFSHIFSVFFTYIMVSGAPFQAHAGGALGHPEKEEKGPLLPHKGKQRQLPGEAIKVPIETLLEQVKNGSLPENQMKKKAFELYAKHLVEIPKTRARRSSKNVSSDSTYQMNDTRLNEIFRELGITEKEKRKLLVDAHLKILFD